MIENVSDINKNEIQQKAKQMLNEGYRLITLTCVEHEDEFEILYNFGKEYEMNHFRVKISKDEEIDSISQTYFCALLHENEIKDLFGVKIKNILIDYDGKFLLSDGSPQAPMCNKSQIEVEVRR